MPKFITLLILPFIVTAQQNYNNLATVEQPPEEHHRYVSKENGKVYDIEIIIFAYKKALPNAKTYQDKSIINNDNALWLQAKPVELVETLPSGSQMEAQQNFSNTTNKQKPKEYTVNIGKATDNEKILAWFKHEPQHHKMSAIWQRLLNDNNIVPLIHENWRQQQTAFDSPIYVNIGHQNINTIDSKIDTNKNSPMTNEESHYNESNTQKILPDFHLAGKVALSKGRFIHFSNQLKLYRQYYDDEGYLKNMTFSLLERRQIKPKELHYFDSPWLGSIVKVTEFTGKIDHE